MPHPFARIPPRHRWPLLVVLTLGMWAFMAVLWLQGRPLTKGAAPCGILSFEFAWSRDRAEEILAEWRPDLTETARRQLFIDFGFILFYPLAISFACAMLSDSRFNARPKTGVALSWAVLVAGPLDVAEDLALLHMLDNGATDSSARIAACCAGPKFLLVLAALGYLVWQGATVRIRKRRHTPGPLDGGA